MASLDSQLIEEVTAHAHSDSLEDARKICADGTYFPNNLHIYSTSTVLCINDCKLCFLLLFRVILDILVVTKCHGIPASPIQYPSSFKTSCLSALLHFALTLLFVRT